MRQEITIGDQTVACVSNAATPVIYRQVFHEDLLVFLQEMSKAKNEDSFVPGTGEMLCKLAYIMHEQAIKKTSEIRRFVSEDTFLDWLADFAPLDFEMSGGAILGVYYSNEKTTSTAKNA